MGGDNVFCSRGEWWVLDWESSHAEAPAATDHLGFWLRDMATLTLTRPEEVLRRVRQQFGHYQESDVLMALAYLASVEFQPADDLLQSWIPGESIGWGDRG
jgi:hypothetical protein